MVKKFNAEEFRVKFRAFFALLCFVGGMAFLFCAVFSETAAKSEYAGTIVGFIAGTLLTLVLTFYFGSSDNSQSETAPPADSDLLSKINKKEPIQTKPMGAESGGSKIPKEE